MGIVYLAVQEHPVRRQAALKIIKPGMDSRRVIARFEAELQTLALLDHPHIAHVLDAGTTDSGLPYFVMEYVEGQSITEYCDQNRLSIEDRLRLFVQVCQAVHHAHQKGFIHRDIKPSNILVAVQDGRPVPKVIDFGVARALGQPLTQETLSTQEGQLIGTLEYMSPEQIDLAHEGADTRSDVYSLGVLLYVLLAGVLPFESEALREGGLEHLRRLVREQDPKTPSTRLTSLGKKATEAAAHRQTDVRTLAMELHRELEWIPLKAMRKEREQRYRSAAELADDIQNYLNGDPLIAGPPSRLYRARKFVRRHRASVIATVIVGLAITVGAVLSLAMYIRAQVQTEQARAVSGLLNNTVLRALDPYREQGGELTALSVLDAVAAGVEGRFRNTPLIEADIRNRLGRTYEANSQYDRAIQHLQRALDIRRRGLGDHDPLTIDTMYRLAWTLTCTGRAREAEPLFFEVVAEYVRQFGEEDLRSISAKRMLADNYLGLGDRGTAMRMYQEVLGTARRALGNDNEVAIMATFRIGNINAALGHYDEAERWYREAF
jgi:non-specific serine/threonine protein kinase/serine/threonine-protein kinase